MALFLVVEKIDRIDKSLGLVVRGRRSLYNGNVQEAITQLEKTQKIKPDLYEALLLKAEISLKTNKPELAKPILLSLSADTGAPAWIRAMADGFLKTVP
jgi:thioredoxin-like negative regulator of GroEL